LLSRCIKTGGRGTETIVLLDKAEIIVEAGLNMQKNV